MVQRTPRAEPKNKALVDERIIVSKARAADFKEWF